MIQKDSKNQSFIEVEVNAITNVRLTLVDNGTQKLIRFNTRDQGESPRPGPQIPIEKAGDIQKALTDLLLSIK